MSGRHSGEQRDGEYHAGPVSLDQRQSVAPDQQQGAADDAQQRVGAQQAARRLVDRRQQIGNCVQGGADGANWGNRCLVLRRALDGAGITFLSRLLVAPHLARGSLVHVLPEWLFGRFTIYAALPTRKFMPARTRAFLDFLSEFAPQSP